MTRPIRHDDVSTIARRYTDRAMAVLAAIMKDEAAPPKVRAMAAGSILIWGGGPQRRAAPTKSEREAERAPVGVEWSGTPRAD